MTILSASPKNATATLAMFRLLTQLAKERGIMLSHPVVMALIQRTQAWVETLRTLDAVDSRITQVDVDSLVGTATAEGALPVASTLTVSNTDGHPTRYALLLEPTDEEMATLPLMRLLNQVEMAGEPEIGDLRAVATITAIMGKAWANTLVTLLKAIVSSLSNTSGTAATVYGLTAYKAAIKARRLIATGQGLTLLQATGGWDGIENDILTSTSAIQMSALAQRIVNEAGTELFFNNVYMGTDVMVTTGLPTAPAADQYGGTIYPGCLTLKACASRSADPNRVVLVSTPFFEIYGLGYAGGSVSQYEMVWKMGLTVLNANLGFRILHD